MTPYVGVAAATCTVGMVVWPQQPNLPTYNYEQAHNESYKAGGRKCQPKALAAIRLDRARERQEDECAQKAEDHRLQANDLIQQTRAADAAKAQTVLAFQSAWTDFFQTLGGILTLAAAVFAAKYARDAAEAAKESLRPWLDIEIEPDWTLTYMNKVYITANVTVKNTGSSPASDLRLGTSVIAVPPIHDDSLTNFHKHEPTEFDTMKSALLSRSEFVEQQMWSVDWGDSTDVDPDIGITPLIGLSISYRLPAGGTGRTVRWFWIGASPVSNFKPTLETLGTVEQHKLPEEGTSSHDLSDKRDLLPIRFLGEAKGHTALAARPAGYGRVD